jgi:hypothetical protein
MPPYNSNIFVLTVHIKFINFVFQIFAVLYLIVLLVSGLNCSNYISSPWWWRQQAPLKHRQTCSRLYGAITQKTTTSYLLPWEPEISQIIPIHLTDTAVIEILLASSDHIILRTLCKQLFKVK